MKKIALLLAINSGIALLSEAQCILSETHSAATIADDNSFGTRPWSSLSNAAASDNQFAQSAALVLAQNTHYLSASGFGFTIPTSDSVCGIEVLVEKTFNGALGNVTDASVKILRNSAISGTNKASGAAWPSGNSYVTYGSSSDKWGCTWTPADINASGFGVVIAANLGGVVALPTAKIDHIYINVYYSSTLPVTLLHFTADCIADGIMVSWVTASERNNDYFEIERSENGIQWKPVARIQGAQASDTLRSYSWKDSETDPGLRLTYYRLKQQDLNGRYQHLATIAIKNNGLHLKDEILFYPNPAGNVLNIRYISPKSFTMQISIVDATGKTVKQHNQKAEPGNNQYTIDVSDLLAGTIYIATVRTETGSLVAKFNR